LPLDIVKWLADIGLGQYADTFTDNDIDFDTLQDLTDADLEKLGVLSMGHRKRLLRAVHDLPAPQQSPAPVETAEAERRQLTVMFCDLVGSTALSETLDPEDLRELNKAYQEAASAEIERYAGFVARYMGDGILAYFGYPRAHENDAERSVRAALAIQLAAKGLNNRFRSTLGTDLAIRVGIATGLVVVGDLIGHGASRESPVVGQTPNLAARLEALAEPGSVVVSPLTRSLVGERFDWHDLGEHRLKGISGAVNAWQVLGERAVEDRNDARRNLHHGTLVGRERELGALEQRWASSRKGSGQMVLIRAEAGLGKSRLLAALEENLGSGEIKTLVFDCSPYHQSTALYPFVRQLTALAGFEAGDSEQQRLEKLTRFDNASEGSQSGNLAILAELLDLPVTGESPLQNLTPAQRKTKTLQVLLGSLLAELHERPTLLILEDAHWLDPTSIEFVSMLIQGIDTLPGLLLITCRPEFTPPWTAFGEENIIELNKLQAPEIERIIDAQAGNKTLPDVAVEQIIARSDGVPLYVEELTRAVIGSDLLVDRGSHYDLASPHLVLEIPATVQDSLMARLDRIGPAKFVAQLGAVAGRRFSLALLAAVSQMPGGELLEAIDRLCAEEVLLREGESDHQQFEFRHALLRDVAYASLLRKTRQQLHAEIAAYLESNHPELADASPELVAHHHSEAANHEPALGYWLNAGKKSVTRGTNLEAISHLHRALEMLEALPDNAQRGDRELEILMLLGPVLLATRGWSSAEAKNVYERARALCQNADNRRQTFNALWGIWLFNTSSANIPASHELLDQLFDIAELEDDQDLLMEAHHASWGTTTWLGEFETALDHIDKGMAIYDPARHQAHCTGFGGHDPGVCGKCQAGISRWFVGDVDQALALCEEGVAWSRQMSHPPTEAHALLWLCLVHQLRREADAVMNVGDELVQYSNQQGLMLFALMGSRLRAWARLEHGDLEGGVADLEYALERAKEMGFKLGEPYVRTLLAGGYVRQGRLDGALTELESALLGLRETGELLWEPEVLRVRGEVERLTGKDGNNDRARETFTRAISIAQTLGSKSLALRASTSLAQLLHDEGRPEEAHATLQPVFGGFSEGLDTADLLDARCCLEIRPR
jgi:class 3 adenylate cyclase/tetratricopeptide (TPR) repeat protein